MPRQHPDDLANARPAHPEHRRRVCVVPQLPRLDLPLDPVRECELPRPPIRPRVGARDDDALAPLPLARAYVDATPRDHSATSPPARNTTSTSFDAPA